MYKKGGRKISRVQVDDTSLKDKEYLGFEVLEGEVGDSFYGSRVGSSFRCSVEIWSLWYGILRIFDFVDSFVVFKVNDNRNVNDNGNDNGNGGEAL